MQRILDKKQLEGDIEIKELLVNDWNAKPKHQRGLECILYTRLRRDVSQLEINVHIPISSYLMSQKRQKESLAYFLQTMRANCNNQLQAYE